MRIGIALMCGMLLMASVLSSGERKPWKDMSVQVGDIKIHYIEAGAGSRTLVFVPGWTMIAEVWREQIPYFSARGFRVIAFDPRSQGLTTKTDGGNTYHQQAADLHAFLKTLKVQKSVLVGWSAGVNVLLEYVSSPETLQPEKIVLADGAPAAFRDADYPGVFTLRQARSQLLALQEDRSKETDKFVRGMFKRRQLESLYTEIIEGSLKTPTGAAVSLFADAFTGDRRLLLVGVSVPTLIVVTEELRGVGEYMQAKIRGSRLEVIPNAGHALFLDAPQTFNQILESFLGEP